MKELTALCKSRESANIFHDQNHSQDFSNAVPNQTHTYFSNKVLARYWTWVFSLDSIVMYFSNLNCSPMPKIQSSKPRETQNLFKEEPNKSVSPDQISRRFGSTKDFSQMSSSTGVFMQGTDSANYRTQYKSKRIDESDTHISGNFGLIGLSDM